MSLNNSKAFPKDTIPPNIIKDHIDVLHKNSMDLNSAISPNNMKLGDVTDKANNRPVNILPSISKIYERLMYYQINNYMENKSFKNFGFRKGFSAQHCLIVMLEKLRTDYY